MGFVAFSCILLILAVFWAGPTLFLQCALIATLFSTPLFSTQVFLVQCPPHSTQPLMSCNFSGRSLISWQRAQNLSSFYLNSKQLIFFVFTSYYYRSKAHSWLDIGSFSSGIKSNSSRKNCFLQSCVCIGMCMMDGRAQCTLLYLYSSTWTHCKSCSKGESRQFLCTRQQIEINSFYKAPFLWFVVPCCF